MTEPEQYILKEWDSMCKSAYESLHGDNPLIEDEVLVEMQKYVASLNLEIKQLKMLLGEAATDLMEWGGYAPDWAKQKHDLDGDVKKYQDAASD